MILYGVVYRFIMSDFKIAEQHIKDCERITNEIFELLKGQDYGFSKQVLLDCIEQLEYKAIVQK